MTRPLSLLLHPLPYLLSHPNIQNLLVDVSPFSGRKQASLCPLPVIRSKGDFKKIWIAILMPQTNTSNPLSL
jgi:hypothetical protein